MKTVEAEEVTNVSDSWSRKWVLWSHQVIGDGRSIYIRRLEILRTPWFSIMLHRIYRPDQQRELHDHPWNFFSIVLWGAYLENTPDGLKWCRWWNRKRAEDSHSIRFVNFSPVWTLVFTGPKRRVWGFYSQGGWVRWDQYEKLNDA